MKIAVVGPSRLPIAPPFGGGLEVFVHRLVSALRLRGVEVDLFAARGSIGHIQSLEFPGIDWTGFEASARDDAYPPGAMESEAAAYRRVRKLLERSDYDLVHNNSVHPAMLVMDPGKAPPMITTLHVPPQPELQQIVDTLGPSNGRFTAVSRFTADQWRIPTPVDVIHNSVDTDQWRPGPGGQGVVWFGRITREKAPHIAIDVSRRLGLPLTLIGRCVEPPYFRKEIAPRLGPDIRWLGSLPPEEIARTVGHADVALVTPEWDEPFGLVIIEALACGTPVAAFARGGVTEVLKDSPAHLAVPGDVDDLVRAARAALQQPREHARRTAVRRFDIHTMLERYLTLFEGVLTR
ncbi:glycosyltransferase family 4 protein [Kocuria coralli]|uniref:Glycosyltransferase family 4 protein n=1 Tax=Kocuria coralli TaxID=1461025 RepID=A0A5J5KWU8_9MICC|nr:glycosyltransferase [Kocuria coralli]KAA9393878.1 glycosyltransferase family 4 protein [Kocuria coralli]